MKNYFWLLVVALLSSTTTFAQNQDSQTDYPSICMSWTTKHLSSGYLTEPILNSCNQFNNSNAISALRAYFIHTSKGYVRLPHLIIIGQVSSPRSSACLANLFVNISEGYRQKDDLLKPCLSLQNNSQTIVAPSIASQTADPKALPKNIEPVPQAENRILQLFPIYSRERKYVGSLTQIKKGIFIGAAHVLSLINPALAENWKREEKLLFQFKSDAGVFLDAVALVDLREFGSVARAQSEVENLFKNSNVQAGDRVRVQHAVVVEEVDGSATTSVSELKISKNINSKYFYLVADSGETLSWGSSGSLVMQKNNQALLGILQCYVTTSAPQGKSIYYRALSSDTLSGATPIEVQVLDLAKSDYELKNSHPISAKIKCDGNSVDGKGGGGGITSCKRDGEEE